jgi:hypothetical protein
MVVFITEAKWYNKEHYILLFRNDFCLFVTLTKATEKQNAKKAIG